jgi:hypothetical protein
MSGRSTLKWIAAILEKKVQSKEIDTPFVKSENQLADILFKGLSVKIFEDISHNLGLFNLYHPNLRGSVKK